METSREKSSNKGPVIAVLLCAALLVITVVLTVFFHFLPKREIKALADVWKSGNIDSIMGIQPSPEQDLSKEEKEFQENLFEEFGDMMPGSEEPAEDDEPLLENILTYTELEVKTPFIIRYPCKATVVVEGPDMVKLLQTLNYEDYSDGRELFHDVKEALSDHCFETKRTEVEVVIDKNGKTLCLAEPSSELVDALYGGVLSLYAEEELKLYEDLSKE